MNHYLWLDLETTGLDPHNDTIMEIAWALTGPDLVIQQMESYCLDDVPHHISNTHVREMHTNNGLISDLERGVRCSSLVAVDSDLCEILGELAEGPIFLSGSGIHFDLGFLRVWECAFLDLLHYRLMDVSVVGRFLQDFCNIKPPSHTTAHRALDDALLSIERAREYRKMLT